MDNLLAIIGCKYWVNRKVLALSTLKLKSQRFLAEVKAITMNIQHTVANQEQIYLFQFIPEFLEPIKSLRTFLRFCVKHTWKRGGVNYFFHRI